jgi:aryl-alcohol dehydrogenase-like predicted oxidoreductase
MKYEIIRDQDGNQHKLSKIVLGVVNFGTTMPEELSFQAMDLYRHNGGNVIDTARFYCDWLESGHGISEKTVGKWLDERNCREEFIIVTKGGHPPLTDMQHSRLTKQDIFSDVSDSLEALRTDYIDLYFLHRDDESIPVEKIMDPLDELIKLGKVRMIGASNWRVERILEANEYAKKNGKTPFTASQIQWSYAVANRKEAFGYGTISMDDQQYQLYLKTGIPVLAYTSQAGGVFARGYKEDLSDIAKKHEIYYSKENILRYQSLLKFCKENNVTPTQAALNYIIEDKLNGFAIVGCSKLEQLQEVLNIGKM